MRKVNKVIFMVSLLLYMILLPLGSYALGNETMEIRQLSENKNVKIEKFIEEKMSDGKIPGLSVVIVEKNKTIYQKGFGFSNLDSKEPVSSKTLFEIGSNSKAFTALGILKLQKEELIRLDDDVDKYIPWLKMNFQGKQARITIEDLLYHTSGIPFNTIDRIPISKEENSLEKTVETLIGTNLDSEPGVRYQYATINYDVLGLIIEKVTGLKFERYIKENLLIPLGLNETYLNREFIGEQVAKGYKLDFLKPRLYDAPEYRGNTPAGYFISNAEDMAHWLKIQIGTNEVSKFFSELIEKSHQANSRVAFLDNNSSYAAGWFISQKGGGIISHGGNNPSYSSFILFRPQDKVGIALLSNINSDHVSVIAEGINEILEGKEGKGDIRDLNTNADEVSIIIICITSLIIISTVYILLKTIWQVIKKERSFKRITYRDSIQISLSLIVMFLLTYCIHISTYTFMGVSWEFVFVWMPSSISVALCLVYITIWLVYVYFLIKNFYKKKDDNWILLLSILSIISGFGNAMIIFTINMAIFGTEDTRVKLLIFFSLGIILYVYGQKILREKLIQVINGIVYKKRMEIVKCLLSASFNEFEEIKKGEIESTLNNDTETISRFANILTSGVTSAITLICCLMYLGFINIYALIFSIIIIIIISGIYYLVGRYANRLGEEARDLQNIFFKFITSLIGGFKELSLNENRKKDFEIDMGFNSDKYREKKSQSALAFANLFIIGELLFTLAIGAIVFIFPLILRNLDNTSIATFVFILLYMIGPVHVIIDTIPNMIEVRISFKRINNLLSQLSSSNHNNDGNRQGGMESEITLKLNELEYLYDKNEKDSFKIGPINYSFKSGEIVFITGGNGSGKSTLAKLISGLYLPSKGLITINNNKVSDWTLREHFSTVFSDFYLFDKLYGIDYKGKENEVRQYLKLLQLEKKVEIVDDQFSTTKLSTGQKKRLALLVAYLEDRPIYLFDEWAADQDPEFRLFFYDTLLPTLKERGKCVIAITHDDYYFNRADKVIKMELGKMVQGEK
ncbi:peptide ABC transporter [Bacillus cereus]|uniref:cyclic peptide export ABC transporter n=1 Tax=Bacillus cereus group TaxID=86661 RepID=UPI000BFDBD8B|nr:MULTISPECIES: cyclic peptide export ABC transporter [Bacillus cereus group]PGS36715.1 peptide ABC transporter [Bacillus cereus]PGU38247.1 peptide ABC transporter [Bacillus cereus]